MARVVISFALDSRKDKRILNYLEGLPRGKKSEAIRGALYAHLGRAGISLADVYQAVKNIERKIGGEWPMTRTDNMQGNPHELDEEPRDVAAKLDGLGL